jgi:xanthine dehydrogenase molybdopterin binding subunit
MPVQFESNGEQFFRPTTLDDLLLLRERFPDANLIAGATELGLEISRRFRKLPSLISLEAIPELKQIHLHKAAWNIGAAATLSQIQEKLAGEIPVFNDMLRSFGSRQIRNRATLGGNLATASPIGDSAPVLLALDAHVVLLSASCERTIPISDFFAAYRKTVMRSGELVKTIILPQTASNSAGQQLCAWFKISKRREVDIATVSACFAVEIDQNGLVRHARLAYGGVAATPVRARRTEAAILNQPWTAQTIRQVLPVLQSEFSPISDVRGSEQYRRGLIVDLLKKFFFDSKEQTETSPLLTSPATILRPHHSSVRSTPPSEDHESAHLHVTGEAIFTDDQALSQRCLEVWPVCAPLARARIVQRDATLARQMPGIVAILLAEDIPGRNDVGAAKSDEILLADEEVFFHGQIIALAVAQSAAACRAAAEKVIVEYESLPPLLSLRAALAAGSFHNSPNFIRRGDVEESLRTAPRTLEGELELNGQNHFYLETHSAWAVRGENETMSVVSSTQHPSEVQHLVAQVLGLSANKIVVKCPRMGGAFGGKETQAATPAVLAALAAWKTGQPVRVRWDRDQDMMLTGHRHPFIAQFKVGFDQRGRLLAARIHLWSNGGWALDLSQAITDRALFHLDNAYFIPAVEFRGQVAKTNLASNTAMRGFGGPQAMVVIEDILDQIARTLSLPPELVRERNLYRGRGLTNTTHYGQNLGNRRLPDVWHQLKLSSEFSQRRDVIAKWNLGQPHAKRGIAITPVKFGISFTFTPLNQAGALVLVYQDGSVQVNHGGTEMGQGLHTNIRSIVARELGIHPALIRVMPTSTDKVPNTSATAASVGTDINGAAVQNACKTLKERLIVPAQRLLLEKGDPIPPNGQLLFQNNKIFARANPNASQITFLDAVRRAYLDRVSLSATGFYFTPGLAWNRMNGCGKPFHYFALGAAVTEVLVDGFTGQHRILRVDVLQDAGEPLNDSIARGQIEGGFVQGLGWLTTEELKWDDRGLLLTNSSDTYKIPSIGDMPEIFNVTFLANAAQKNVVAGTKAVGEPPLMLAISAREALRDAVAAFGPPGEIVSLPVPATSEEIWKAVQERKPGSISINSKAKPNCNQ